MAQNRDDRDPGRRATTEEAHRAKVEALALLQAIQNLNQPAAAEHIRNHPPSPEAIAALAFLVHEIEVALMRERNRNAAKSKRPNSRRELVRRAIAAGATDYSKLKDKAPAEILDKLKDVPKKRIIDAFSKAKG